jgi:hypothetical protein
VDVYIDDIINTSKVEEFEDTKGVIRIRISKKIRHHNDQKKKYKRTNNDLHIKGGNSHRKEDIDSY